MADVTNVYIGACSVSIDGTDVGHTLGGVEVIYTPEYVDITVDKYGKTPVDKALVGEQFKLKFAMAEKTLANIKKAIGAASLTGAGNTRVTVGKNAGLLGSTFDAVFVMHPLQNGGSDYSDDVVIYRGVITSEITLAHKVDEQTVIEVEVSALIDETKADGRWLGHIGDSTT